MLTTTKIVRYILMASVVFLLLGLLWWYFFLRSQSQTITSSDSARGYDTGAASFQNAIGSTYNNIVSGISSFINDSDTWGTGKGSAPKQLWHVTKTPVAGMSFVGSGATLRLRFVERSTGQILEADPADGTVVRLTNKLFPKTYEAVFGRAEDIILRSLDEIGAITSFSGTIATSSSRSSSGDTSATTSSAELVGKQLERNMHVIAPIPGTRELLYAIENPQGGVDIIRSLWDGSKKKSLFSSSLTGWKPGVLADGRIFLIQNPADDAAGFAYELKDGALKAQARDVPGLTFLPRTSSTAFLLGESRNGSLALYVRARDDAAIASLPLKTVADKCVWAPPSTSGTSAKKTTGDSGPLVAYCAVPLSLRGTNFLDDWYRGVVHTADAWWRVDANADTVELIPVDGGASETFDVENPIVDLKGENIAFMNAEDKTLWLLRIGTAANSASTTRQ